MDIVISGASSKPIYQQIYEQIAAQIITGELAPDTPLLPIRTVAKELRVSVITVKKAWEELERQGLICSFVGRGCFVAPMESIQITDRREALTVDRLKSELAYYRSMGITREQYLELVERYWDQG